MKSLCATVENPVVVLLGWVQLGSVLKVRQWMQQAEHISFMH